MMIALHHIAAADHDFSDRASRQDGALVIPYGDLDARQRSADRPQLARAWHVQRDNRSGFGLSVAFINRNAESFFKHFSHGHRQRLTAGNWESNGRHIKV